MVTVLSAIALYLMFGVVAAALVYSGPEKHESYIELTMLLFVVAFWPAIAVYYCASNIELPHVRNPFWTGGTP